MDQKKDRILRVKKDRNYKTIPLDAVAGDERLSWKAKGLHTYLISRPDGWRFNHQDLVNRSTDGKYAVSSGLGELQEYGYLSIERVRQEGRFQGTVWTVSEVPMNSGSSPHPKNQDTAPHPGFPDPGNPHPENPDCSKKKGSKQQEGSSCPSLRSGPEGAGSKDGSYPSRFLTRVVWKFLWQGRKPPAQAPKHWSISAEHQRLKPVWKQLGTEETFHRLWGLRLLAAAGELPGTEPGQGFTLAVIEACEGEGPSLWARAEEAFRQSESEEAASKLIDQLASTIAGGSA